MVQATQDETLKKHVSLYPYSVRQWEEPMENGRTRNPSLEAPTPEFAAGAEDAGATSGKQEDNLVSRWELRA